MGNLEMYYSTWVPGGGTEILSIYFFYLAKIHKSSVQEKIKLCERYFMCYLNNPSIHFT